MKSVVVAAVYNNPIECRKLTDLLLTVYPGGVIYEFADFEEAMFCMQTHKLDAIFLELNDRNLEPLCQIRQHSLSVPVIAWADNDSLLEEAMWNGASSFLVNPMLPEQLQMISIPLGK